MKRALLCLAMLALTSTTQTVQASQINSDSINWSYRFSASPLLISTGGGLLYLPGSTGSTSMSSAPYDPVKITTKVGTLTDATKANPQHVSDAPFALVLHIKDQTSGIAGAVTFSGDFNGDVWKSGSTLNPTFTSAQSQTLWLGHHIYDITFKSFKPPTGSGQDNFGKFVFDVAVHHNPEPSSLVLAGIGAPLFGVILRRRRQRS